MLKIIVSPYNVVGFLEGAGHFWVYLQYVLGLRELGCEVHWLEEVRLDPPRGEEGARRADFLTRMKRFGLERSLVLYTRQRPGRADGEEIEFIGRTREEAEQILAEADLLLNFHYAISPGLLARFRRTALVDIDPGLLQFWISREQLRVPRHDLYFTTGENVGVPGSRIPDCGLRWIRIRPPVSLERWPPCFDASSEFFTTVSNWDADDWVVDGSNVYENTKRVSFLEYLELPRLTRQPIELALFLRTEQDEAERRLLERIGWRVRPSREVASTPEHYQDYIQASRGEFSCAKRFYVRSQGAWVSDRTICYLASGKPVVIQHTGPSSWLPEGEGLFRFRTLAESAAALERVNSDYEHHARAARRIAESFFDSKRILKDVLGSALG